jgi:four helix bundle protein
MTNDKPAKFYDTMSEVKRDLEERTFQFAKDIFCCVKHIPASIVNREVIKQVVRSGGSVGANYIEANEALGKKDFLMRVRISRKEAKETMYWLRLLRETNEIPLKELDVLLKEADELKRILSSILNKYKTV